MEDIRGIEKREETQGLVVWAVAMRPGKRRALPEEEAGRMKEPLEQMKARIRAKAEPLFHIIENLFRHKKLRCKGLAKNTAQLFALFGLVNLLIAKRRLLAFDSPIAS